MVSAAVVVAVAVAVVDYSIRVIAGTAEELTVGKIA